MRDACRAGIDVRHWHWPTAAPLDGSCCSPALPPSAPCRSPIAAAFGAVLLLGIVGAWLPGTRTRQYLHVVMAAQLQQQQQGRPVLDSESSGDGSVRNPILPHLPDPFLLQWEGRWYAYGSVGNSSDGSPMEPGYQIGFRVFVGDANMANWTDGGMVLSPPPDGSMGVEEFWAPEIIVNGGKFYMSYTASTEATNQAHTKQRIWIAVANKPTGPFQYHAGPMRDEWMLDSHIFEDDGLLYMYFGCAGRKIRVLAHFLALNRLLARGG